MLLNCGVRENSWESLGLQGDQTSQSQRKSILIFIGGADAEAEGLILWPPDVKNQLIGKHSDAGKNWSQEEKGTTEEEIIGWHHRFNGYEIEQTLGDGEGQGSLTCCSSWGHEESDTAEWLNWTGLNWISYSWQIRFEVGVSFALFLTCNLLVVAIAEEKWVRGQ